MTENISRENPHFVLWIMLNQAIDAALKLRRHELTNIGIRLRQSNILLIIRAINQSGGIATIDEISRWGLLEKHTVSAMTSRMQKGGLIVKGGQYHKMTISITKLGENVIDQVMDLGSIGKIFDSMSQAEREAVGAFSHKLLNESLNILNKPRPLFPSQMDNL